MLLPSKYLLILLSNVRFIYLQQVERRNGWINVGDLQGAVHFKIVKYERIKFLVIALKDSIEIYAWAPKPYHKFMAFKSFGELAHRPLLVDLTVEEGTRLKVIYGSADGFHAVDLDTTKVFDIYLPKHVRGIRSIPLKLYIYIYVHRLKLIYIAFFNRRLRVLFVHIV